MAKKKTLAASVRAAVKSLGDKTSTATVGEWLAKHEPAAAKKFKKQKNPASLVSNAKKKLAETGESRLADMPGDVGNGKALVASYTGRLARYQTIIDKLGQIEKLEAEVAELEAEAKG